MGCQGSKDAKVVKAKPVKDDKSNKKVAKPATGSEPVVVTEQTLSAVALEAEAKKGPSKLRKLLSKDKSDDSTDSSTTGNRSSTGNKSAKVRPMTSEEVIQKRSSQPEVLPKSVAYEIDLTSPGVTSGKPDLAHGTEIEEIESKPEVKADQKGDHSQTAFSGFKLKLPRRLPKLSSITISKDKDLTQEELEAKQAKAERKRKEHLEKKKAKARKFVAGSRPQTSSGSEHKPGSEPEVEEDEVREVPSAPPISADVKPEVVEAEAREKTPEPEVDSDFRKQSSLDRQQQEEAWKSLTQTTPIIAQIEAI